MRTRIVAWSIGIFFLGQWSSVGAQCPDRARFYLQMQQIVALGTDSAGVEKQRQALAKWLPHWRACHPEADSIYVAALIRQAFVQSYIAHYRDTDNTQAIASAQQAIAVYKTPGLLLKASDLSEAYYRLGVYYQRDDEAGKAIAALLEAIEVGRNHRQALEWANRAYPYVIFHYFTRGDLYKALQYAEQGEKVAYVVGDTVATSKLLLQKSQILFKLGRFEEAKQAIEPANAFISRYPDHHQSYATGEKLLGTILRELGRPAESLKHFLLAYTLAKENNHSNLSDFASALGRYYFTEGNNTRALRYYQEALKINRSRSRSVQLDNIALLYRRLKKYEQALKYHQEGLNAFSNGFSDPNVASLPTAGLLRSEQQQDYFLFLVQDKADTWLDYAIHTPHDPAKLKNALRTYMLADSIIDFMRWEYSGEGSKLFWRDQTRSMYERAIQTCYLLNDPASALHFFEKSRAVLLSDRLNQLRAQQRVDASTAASEENFQRRIDQLRSDLGTESAEGSAALRLRAELLAVQREQEEFVALLETRNPAYYHSKYDNHVPSLRTLQRTILAPVRGNPYAFLSYFVGDSAVYGLYVTTKRATLKRLDRPEYLKHLDTFRKVLVSRDVQNRDFPAYLRASFDLYKTLISPFEVADGTKLIISPDGDFIPFAALSLSAGTPDYLIQHHPISYTYSAGFLEHSTRTQESTWPTSRTFLGMAPVTFSPALQQAPLPGSEDALEEVGNRFYFSNTLIGTEASRGAFIEKAPNYRIVQLFTHADADSGRIEPTLYFADSVLLLSDLPDATPFRTQLMVLSACNTGLGKNQRGEGVFSLARGFAEMGVPSTLTTLWSVENQSMYGLTKLFYQNSTLGLPLDEALQKGQIEWLQTAARSDQLPYAWAGVVLIGQTAPLTEPLNYGAAYILLLLVLLGGGLVWWRMRTTSSRGPSSFALGKR